MSLSVRLPQATPHRVTCGALPPGKQTYGRSRAKGPALRRVPWPDRIGTASSLSFQVPSLSLPLGE